jgi:hypothetical protein
VSLLPVPDPPAKGPGEGTDVGELMRLTGMSPSGRVPAVWSSTPKQAALFRSAAAAGARLSPRSLTVSDRLTICLISPLARVCT